MNVLSRFSDKFDIAGRSVGKGEACLVIAEGGVNHFGDMGKAFALVDMAVQAGADIFKTQHFKTDLLINQSAADWRDRLRPKELRDDQIVALKEYCDRRGIIFMCTGHDEESIDFLDRVVNVPAFKVGSGEVKNWSSIKALAGRGKPIILSTGMYEIDDVKAAMAAALEGGCTELAILHCVTAYPADPADINLAIISQLRGLHRGPVGYSDHTVGTAVPLAAVALGADIIEKHITIDRDIPNAQDWKVSCDESNFARFIEDIRDIEAARGGGVKAIAASEQGSMAWARKSLVAKKTINPGTIVTRDMLIAQRPGTGLPPSRIEEILGRVSRREIPAGTIVSLDSFE